jgi:aspartyl-tRNA(Asn)/glutamyl-tRNA(Gln) amidotransferase subunit B
VEFETVIGLEIHAQLLTKTKLFCGCRSVFGDTANSHGCPVCLGLPGALPVLNRQVVEMALRAACALNCTINHKSIFARKNYFYPDLPKGYQISQYDQPLCEHGALTIYGEDGSEKKIGVTRIHLEEDAGKLIHDQDVDSLFDVNRCGTPLIEIVSEPDLRTPQQAYAYLSSLKRILEYLEICDCNMEEGSLRCDANISIRPRGENKLGTKTELKNMNSFRGVEKALEYEIMRQKDVVQSGGHIVQQTFLWDAQKNQTVAMRSKESAHDYRYFPEPDLVPLVIDQAMIERERAAMPELPEPRMRRFMSSYGLNAEHSQVLTDAKPVAGYYEKVVALGAEPRMAATWVMGEVLRICKETRKNIDALRVTPTRLAELLKAVAGGTVSAAAGKRVFDRIEEADQSPTAIIEEMGLKQISDTGALESIVRKIIDDNPAEAQRLKAGDAKLMGFFVGQAMKASRGKGNPKEINRILSTLLGQ